MAKLSKEAARELKELAALAQTRKDFVRLSKNRHNPFIVNGKVDLDRWVAFLSDYGDFVNHTPKPFRKIRTQFNKL